MANTRRSFGLLASGMVWSVAASAANYHVNGSIGVDSRTTVEAQNSTSPWRSIQKCNQNAMPGDTCLIHSGTYAEYIAPASGLNGAYVTFQALPGHTVVMNGFRLDNQSYVKIGGDQADEGLTLRMGPNPSAGLIEFANNAHHIIIQNNDIGGLKGVTNPSNHACIRQSGIGTQRSSHITIKNNRIAWCGSIPPNSETWRRSHFYVPGDFVHASTANKSVFLEATTGGLSGAAEPLWPTSGGATLTDGDGGLTWVSREFGLRSAVQAVGDRWLIEGNTIAHVSDFIAPYGTYMVIRNNTFGPVSCSDVGIANDDDPACDMVDYHVDVIEHSTFASYRGPDLNYMLVENNTLLQNSTPNGHFALMHATNRPNEHNSIIRFNGISNLGTAFVLNDARDGAPFGHYHHLKVYNNTISSVTHKSCAIEAYYSTEIPWNGPLHCASVNNLYYNAGAVQTNGGCNAGPHYLAIDPMTFASFTLKNPLVFLPGCVSNCASGYILSAPGAQLQRDPKFIHPLNDLRLQVGSAAIDTGGALTKVASTDSLSGASLVVDDADYFQDGAGIVAPDWVRVGSSTVVQIASVDYTSNTITLAHSVNRQREDPVYLYKDSNGRVVLNGSKPDIGAYEYSGFVPPAGPKNLHVR